MHLVYNGYSHAENEVWLNIVKQAIYGPANNRQKERQIWTINGVVTTDTSEADLTAKIDALETAYSTNGGDLLLYGNSNTLTDHTLYSSGTINGTQVQSIQWLPGNPGIWGSGTEYVNKRSYRIIVTAERLWYDSNLVYYQTTLAATGTCGQKSIWVRSLTGDPQQQIVQLHTTQTIVQSGMNIGLVSPMAPDSPLFGTYEKLDQRRIIYSSPQQLGINQNTHFPTRWMFFFETPVPLVA